MNKLIWFVFPSFSLFRVAVSSFGSVSDFPTIFVGQEKGVLEEVSFSSMIQYQYAGVHSDQGDGDDASFRRFRVGLKARSLGLLRFSSNLNLKTDRGLSYKNLSTAYIVYSPYGSDKSSAKSFCISVGKLKPRFSHEYAIHASKIKTLERSLLVNQLAPAKATGMTVAGELESFSYSVGCYSGDDADEFSTFGSEGTVFILKVQKPFKESLDLAIDYMVASFGQEITAGIQHAVSFSSVYNGNYESGFLSCQTDFLFSDSESPGGNAIGLILLPSVKHTERVESVLRYQLSASSAEQGLNLQNRYEQLPDGVTAGGSGNFYQAAYLGLNYHLKDNAFKVMSGLEYACMDGGLTGQDYDGWTWASGLRMYF